MGLFEQLKANSSTFHFKTKEEIDVLFTEMEEMGQYVDSELDLLIRMSIHKLKLQLYYVLKLEEYRRKTISVKTKESVKDANATSEPSKKKKKKKVKQNTQNKQTKVSLEEQVRREKGLTKEQLIAANKAKVAKFHPEPDFSTISRKYKMALRKLEYEREMKEKTKNQWVSIVSIPMGGMN